MTKHNEPRLKSGRAILYCTCQDAHEEPGVCPTAEPNSAEIRHKRIVAATDTLEAAIADLVQGNDVAAVLNIVTAVRQLRECI